MRREDGFTLVELLVAMVVGIVIFTGAMAVMSVMFRHSAGVVQRTDAAQRGRLALDQITRELRSQTCGGDPAVTSRVLAGADADAMTFYADLGSGPERHTLTLQDGRITDSVIPGVPQSSTDEVYSYTGAATTRTLLDHVEAVSGAPFLAYFAYPQDAGPADQPSVALAPGGSLSATDAGHVARVQVEFRVLPSTVSSTDSATARRDALDESTLLEDDVAVRVADPSQDNPNPFLC